MSSLDDKEIDLKTLLDQINSAFGMVSPPISIGKVVMQKDFDLWYATDKFKDLGREFYDSNTDEVQYLMQFALIAYLDHYGVDLVTDSNLGLFLFWFGHFEDEVDFIRNRYLSFYRKFDGEQRTTICSFLRFLLKYEMDEGYVDEEMVRYWCTV